MDLEALKFTQKKPPKTPLMIVNVFDDTGVYLCRI